MVPIAFVVALAVVVAPTARALAPLPDSRPPLWPQRSYADAEAWSCKMNHNNVLYLNIEHGELPGVFPEMLEWLYAGGGLLQKSVHPVDGKSYSNFLLMHPRDHVATAAIGPIPAKEQKTEFYWYEHILTGCHEQPNGAAQPYVCPRGPANPGFVAASPPAAVAAAERTDVTSTPISISNNGIEFGIERCNERGQCAYVVKSKHQWKATPTGVRVSTTHQFGLDLGLAADKINPRVIEGWTGPGVDPFKKCQRAVLHAIEEFGSLPHFLPAAYVASGAAEADRKAKGASLFDRLLARGL